MAICPSMRASGAPRQKWMPMPKAMWRLSVRVMSRRSGSGNWAGSRLAAPRNGITISPLGMVLPPMTRSSLGMRAVRCTGPS